MITTDRNQFVGSHFTPACKDALRAEAAQRRISMSELQYLFAVEALSKLGYILPELKDKPRTPPAEPQQETAVQ